MAPACIARAYNLLLKLTNMHSCRTYKHHRKLHNKLTRMDLKSDGSNGYDLTSSVPRTDSSPDWEQANGLLASSSLILGITSGTSSTSTPTTRQLQLTLFTCHLEWITTQETEIRKHFLQENTIVEPDLNSRWQVGRSRDLQGLACPSETRPPSP